MEEIVKKIAKLNAAMADDDDSDNLALYKKKIASLENQLAELAKKDKKEVVEEKKELTEAEQKIKKLENALVDETDKDLIKKFKKKINELKGIKDEVKDLGEDIVEKKKDIKDYVKKDVKSPKKEVRKVAIKKIKEIVDDIKKIEKKKDDGKDKFYSELDKIINKNKKLKPRYSSEYKGSGKTTDIKRDAARPSKPVGYRFTGKGDNRYRVPTQIQIRKGKKDGTIDYEARPNRSDVYPKRTVKLADGGDIGMAKGGKIKKVKREKSDSHRFAKPVGLRWKEEATTTKNPYKKRIIARASLGKHPTKKMQELYPEVIYSETRLDKADKKPNRSSADSV